MNTEEKLKQIIHQINTKSAEQDEIKRDLGIRWEYPKNQSDRDNREKWFTLHSQILDLIALRDSLKSE